MFPPLAVRWCMIELAPADSPITVMLSSQLEGLEGLDILVWISSEERRIFLDPLHRRLSSVVEIYLGVEPTGRAILHSGVHHSSQTSIPPTIQTHPTTTISSSKPLESTR
jgi:hypothetical protein